MTGRAMLSPHRPEHGLSPSPRPGPSSSAFQSPPNTTTGTNSPPTPPTPPTPPIPTYPSSLLQFFHSHPPPQTSTPPAPPITSAIHIPTTLSTLSSGFPYPLQLTTATPKTDITPSDWAIFSNSIVNSGRLTRSEKTIALGKGLGRCMIHCFSRRGEEVRRETERATMRKELRRVLSLDDVRGCGCGRKKGSGEGAGDEYPSGGEGLSAVLDLWNVMFFEKRGLRVRVEGPRDLMEELGDNKREREKDRGRLGGWEIGSRRRGESLGTPREMMQMQMQRGGGTGLNVLKPLYPAGERGKVAETEEERMLKERMNRFRVVLEPYILQPNQKLKT